MKLTRNELFKWAKKQTQWTENEMLNPHNPDVADSEIVDVFLGKTLYLSSTL